MNHSQHHNGVGYIRESTDEQDKGYSPENQKNTIERYAKEHNIGIVAWYKDTYTGRVAEKRDDFQRMIADAMQQTVRFDVILIFHSSRFARNIQESQQYKKLLRNKLGIDVVSVTQHFGNPDDPSTFINEGINELFDEYTSRNTSFWVRSNLLAKRQKGNQLGQPPLGYFKKKIGYDKDRDRSMYAKEWTVDPVEAEVVKKSFTLYSSGNYSLASLAAELNKTDVKTKCGNPFTYSSLKAMLSNRSYLGLTNSPRHHYPELKARHPALITKQLFDNVQQMMSERHHTKGRPTAKHRFYLLQGLVYCYRCFNHLEGKENNTKARLLPKMYSQAFISGDKEYYAYGCKFRRENKSCRQQNVKCKVIDQQVIDFLGGFRVPDNIISKTLEHLRKLLKLTHRPSNLPGKIRVLQESKRRLEFVFLNTNELTERQYLERLKEINADISRYSQPETVSRITAEQRVENVERLLRNFSGFWKDDIDIKQRREFAVMTLKRVWIEGENIVAIEPRDEYKPLFVSHQKVLTSFP